MTRHTTRRNTNRPKEYQEKYLRLIKKVFQPDIFEIKLEHMKSRRI